jgi:hypothetical protein
LKLKTVLTSMLIISSFFACNIQSAIVSSNALRGAYTDPAFLTNLGFGSYSHWIQPWRSTLETVPANVFLAGVGMGLNLNGGENPDLIAQMLAKNGVRNVRIEKSWASINFDDESKINDSAGFQALLEACKKWGLRPLILLNSHQGVPTPFKFFDGGVSVTAALGARKVTLDDVSNLVIGRSGFSNLTGYWAAEAIITDIQGKTVTLSKPLPKALFAGTRVPMATLKYRPFSVPGSPDQLETLGAWKRYVKTVSSFVASVMGSNYDLEVWNELTFGSEFLSINNYYDPPLATYDEQLIWKDLVLATAQVLEAQPTLFAGVKLSDGFANTIPWTASSLEPTRVDAISKHPYRNINTFPQDAKGQALDALGNKTNFVPSYSSLLPEYYGTGIQTETLLRDSSPITTDIYGTKHGRNARTSGRVETWITEVNIAPNEVGITNRDEALALKAKNAARYLCFYLNKGVTKLQFYVALGPDTEYGMMLESFATYAKQNSSYPNDDAALTSPSLKVIKRITDTMKPDLDGTLASTRQLEVKSITDTHNHAQFAGDGSSNHPPLFDRELLAVLPYQVNAKRFVIPMYVMTRDVRTKLQPEQFTLELGGIQGAGVKLSLYDPINDKSLPVTLERGDANGIQFSLTLTDYPYLLTVEER